jgi:hypothetical protein
MADRDERVYDGTHHHYSHTHDEKITTPNHLIIYKHTELRITFIDRFPL